MRGAGQSEKELVLRNSIAHVQLCSQMLTALLVESLYFKGQDNVISNTFREVQVHAREEAKNYSLPSQRV